MTGAAQGIGLEIARLLAEERIRVAMCDISQDVHSSAERLREEGLDVHAYPMDVASEASIQTVCGAICKRFDGVQILVNNAGVSPKHDGFKLPIADTSLAEWEMVMRINLTGPFLLSRELLPSIRQAEHGRIINTASVVARYASPLGGGPYNASKVGLITMSRVLALELAGTSVTVNCVAPGRIVTPMTRQFDPTVDRDYLPKVPVRRLGLPRDIANAFRFLASPESAAITGTVIDVNGGTFCN